MPNRNRADRFTVLRAVLGLVAYLCGEASHAEKADREKPMQVEADRVSVDDLKKTSVFEGNVVMTQGTLHVRADKVQIRQDADKFQYATAFGKPITFRQKRDGIDDYIDGTAERMEYNGKLNQVELFQKARLTRNQDEIRGDYIFYDSLNETFRVGPAAASPNSNTPPGRVKMVIQPKTAGNAPPGNSPALPLKPAGDIHKALQD